MRLDYLQNRCVWFVYETLRRKCPNYKTQFRNALYASSLTRMLLIDYPTRINYGVAVALLMGTQLQFVNELDMYTFLRQLRVEGILPDELSQLITATRTLNNAGDDILWLPSEVARYTLMKYAIAADLPVFSEDNLDYLEGLEYLKYANQEELIKFIREDEFGLVAPGQPRSLFDVFCQTVQNNQSMKSTEIFFMSCICIERLARTILDEFNALYLN